MLCQNVSVCKTKVKRKGVGIQRENNRSICNISGVKSVLLMYLNTKEYISKRKCKGKHPSGAVCFYSSSVLLYLLHFEKYAFEI